MEPPYRFTDPARFSFAHGGKDGHPFPVPLRVYDEMIRVLKSAVRNAKLGRQEELGAIKRLDAQARLLEQKASGPPVEELLADERDRSHAYEGRSVFGWALPPEASRDPQNWSSISQSPKVAVVRALTGGESADVGGRGYITEPVRPADHSF
jgi:hypothetical protein